MIAAVALACSDQPVTRLVLQACASGAAREAPPAPLLADETAWLAVGPLLFFAFVVGALCAMAFAEPVTRWLNRCAIRARIERS